MRTIFLFASFISFGVFSQEVLEDCINTNKVIQNEIHSSKNSTVIWQEDFGNGFPSGWTTYTSNTGAGNNGAPSAGNTAECPWKHSTQGSWGYWNSMGHNASGNPVSASDPINSTTSSNGFLISDPDSANHWNGNSGSSSGSTYHFLESYFTTSAIDLTGWPNVSLEFEQNFRKNNSIDLVVSVSADSSTWTDYTVQGSILNNQESLDPEYVSLNISQVAGNQSTVYIKIGWTARVYYWMIDDMKIVETPDNRLSLLDPEFAGWYVEGPTTTGALGVEYTQIPLHQVTAHPYTFAAMVSNTGVLPQTAKLNVEVYDAGFNSLVSTESSTNVLNASDTATLTALDNFTPTSTDDFYFAFWASSTDTITDTIIKSSSVTDTVYARDDGNEYADRELGRDCGSMEMGNYFDVYAESDLTSVSAYMSSGSAIGAGVFAKLYEYNPNGDPIYLTQSDDYYLTSADTGGSWVTIPISYSLSPGTIYLAVIAGYAHPINTSVLGRSQISYPQTCYIFDGCGDVCSGGVNTWCWTSRTHMVRMNISLPPTFIEQEAFDGDIYIYPNPSQGMFSIDMRDVHRDSYRIVVRNILGDIIYSRNNIIDGPYSGVIDLSNFSNGTYFIDIINSRNIVTEKIIKY